MLLSREVLWYFVNWCCGLRRKWGRLAWFHASERSNGVYRHESGMAVNQEVVLANMDPRLQAKDGGKGQVIQPFGSSAQVGVDDEQVGGGLHQGTGVTREWRLESTKQWAVGDGKYLGLSRYPRLYNRCRQYFDSGCRFQCWLSQPAITAPVMAKASGKLDSVLGQILIIKVADRDRVGTTLTLPIDSKPHGPVVLDIRQLCGSHADRSCRFLLHHSRATAERKLIKTDSRYRLARRRQLHLVRNGAGQRSAWFPPSCRRGMVVLDDLRV